MTDKKSFLVSDLANALGVPRTTINDWLKRYDRYLTTEMAGKRKIYTIESFEVLKMVNLMRNEGKSAAQIESELAKKFAIRADEVAAETAVKEEKIPAAPAAEKPVAPEEESPALPALHREEFDRFLGSMESFSRYEKSRRRSAVYVWSFIALLALFAVVTAWYLAQLLNLQNANSARLNRMMVENAAARVEAVKNQESAAAVLNAHKKEIADLRSELAASGKREAAASLEAQKQIKNATRDILKVISESDARHRKQSEELKKSFENELKKREEAVKTKEAAVKAAEEKFFRSSKELEAAKSEAAELRRQLEKVKSELEKTKNAPAGQAGASVSAPDHSAAGAGAGAGAGA